MDLVKLLLPRRRPKLTIGELGSPSVEDAELGSLSVEFWYMVKKRKGGQSNSSVFK